MNAAVQVLLHPAGGKEPAGELAPNVPPQHIVHLRVGGQPPEQVKGEVVGVEVAHKDHHRLGGVKFRQLPLDPVKDEGVLRQLNAEAGVVKIGDLHGNLLMVGVFVAGKCPGGAGKAGRFSTISRKNVENSSPLLQKAQPGP